MEAFAKMWRGEVPLVKVFWLWGVVALAVLTFGVQLLFIPLIMAAPRAAMFVMLVLGVGAFAYQIAVSLGVWRSAGRYLGPKVWAVLARGAVILSFASLAISAIGLSQLFTQDTHDSSRSSANVATTLARTAEHPFTGFWKSDCGDNFGLAIESSGEPNSYSISFCGPGGCFKPGTYRPNTRIAGDSEYRVLDENTIEVKGQDGFSRYIRCE